MLRDVLSAAGDAFCRAASVQLKCGSKHEAATQYVDASTCYKKADPAGNAVSCFYTLYFVLQLLNTYRY